jgi:hypothetical protein
MSTATSSTNRIDTVSPFNSACSDARHPRERLGDRAWIGVTHRNDVDIANCLVVAPHRPATIASTTSGCFATVVSENFSLQQSTVVQRSPGV